MSDLVCCAEIDALVCPTADHPHIVFTGWRRKVNISSVFDDFNTFTSGLNMQGEQKRRCFQLNFNPITHAYLLFKTERKEVILTIRGENGST